MIALSPDPHTLLIVRHGIALGKPALIAACLAGACPQPADNTWPIITWSTAIFFIPSLSKAPLITWEPNAVAESEDKLPAKEPMGVRRALTMTTSEISIFLFQIPFK